MQEHSGQLPGASLAAPASSVGELYPELDGKLRKAFLKGEGIGGILPEMWEYGEEVGRESV